MISQKLKKCNGCGLDKPIWKSHGKEKYCKECWYTKSPPKTLVKQRSPINRISEKRKVEMSIYDKRRLAFLALHSNCQASLDGCSVKATDIHHKAGRVGDDYLNISKWLAVCRSCHSWIETHPEDAKTLGLSESRLKKTE